MMKQLLLDYARYNLWANTRITETILQIPEGQQQQEVKSSYKSLHDTILHIWDAESIWWQRVAQHDRLLIPSKTFQPSTSEVINGLLTQSAEWITYFEKPVEINLSEILPYRNIAGDSFTQPLHEILLHVFNHSTYHRGQLVTILRTLGMEKIPATDFIVWARTEK